MKKWLSLALKLAPIVLAGVPGIPVVLVPLIAEAITDAEQIAGASGTEKKKHVLETVTAGIVVVNRAKGTQVMDPAVVTSVVSPAIDTTIGVINAVQKAHTKPATPLKLVKP